MKSLWMLVLLIAPAFAGGVEESLLEADRAFDRAAAERGLEGWMSFFAEDARFNGPQEIVGKAALREMYTKMFARKDFSIRWQPIHAEGAADGSLGFTYGTAQISWRDDKGEIVRREGRYLTVWRKQKDGSWKVVSDLGS